MTWRVRRNAQSKDDGGCVPTQPVIRKFVHRNVDKLREGRAIQQCSNRHIHVYVRRAGCR